MALPAALSLSIASLSSISSHPHSHLLPSHQINCSFSSPSPCIYSNHTSHSKPYRRLTPWSQHCCFRVSYRFSAAAEGADDNNEEAEDGSFDEAVVLFNTRDYYKCHDFLESLWNNAEEPTRTLIHGILQCAVGFHHLFNQNHKGAMMELGEGLCKLRKMNFKSGPFYQFEQEISAALDFIYQTQIELAACTEDLCVTMDQSERSYQLLGGYAAGQLLYTLQSDPNETMYIVFSPHRSYDSEPPKVKLPTLNATAEHLVACQYK
ncbi:unnamed protein product [Prunus armeniaca]|uniref:TTHA0068-like domain-containing protein n=2 Tax=Prunus TaxID=3754 RepID=A0A6J5XW63_PRUAR|nr:PREDICTED: uncharacterized protein LOC103339049 isoform X1 [Prunus mume]KAH0972643.1 hypothetical protein GBA52_024799 [Prunus armeniaca]CAB4316473.1 unnamed protein product [Prunus armeniaca]